MTTLHDLFPGRYLVGEDLGGQDVTVAVRRLDVEEMGRLDKKGETTQKPVLYFNGVQKGLVLNKTNAVTIAKMYGDEIEAWSGKTVTLYPKREHAFGSDWTVIRIRPRRPEQAPAPERIGQQDRRAVNTTTGEIEDAPRANGHSEPPATDPDALAAEYKRLFGKAVDLGLSLVKDGYTLPPAVPPTSPKLASMVEWLRNVVKQAEGMADAPSRETQPA